MSVGRARRWPRRRCSSLSGRSQTPTGGGVDDDPDLRHNQQPEEREPYSLEISMPGIFAAGVVRQGSVKRVACGVGEQVPRQGFRSCRPPMIAVAIVYIV